MLSRTLADLKSPLLSEIPRCRRSHTRFGAIHSPSPPNFSRLALHASRFPKFSIAYLFNHHGVAGYSSLSPGRPRLEDSTRTRPY
ncbi:hypothetical protein FPOAC1_008531 [Fusarium poae]|uniref:hypothetical protein n=1 Tax=Fusarium poae TaxID=36050 RepID=UPI001CE82B40|nr:hypothetical protein FPOAC1_008531 [Fusarium poae]KAG8669143.1 hypothetical protein FPOAC1_008531 [Fusarium poae]